MSLLPGSEPISASRLILVVEDDLIFRRTLQSALEEEGFVVQTASDGHTAIVQAKAHQPALVLLDMELPVFNGAEVAAQLRAQYGSRVPVILMTADGHAQEKSRQIGAVAFLRKPFALEDFLAVIHHTLASPGYPQQA